jgi:hypothetical protein
MGMMPPSEQIAATRKVTVSKNAVVNRKNEHTAIRMNGRPIASFYSVTPGGVRTSELDDRA